MQSLTTHWPAGYSEAEYVAAVDQLKVSNSEEYYRTQVFPQRCQWIRDQPVLGPESVLFLPVGLQPYGPILTCLAVPARTTVLIQSPESAEAVRQLRAALPDRDYHEIEVDPLDTRQIASRVMSCYSVLGGDRITCDQTSGRKPTTVALAGLAAVNGWRSVYLSSQMHKAFGTFETLIEMPGLFEALGGTHRLAAEACVRRGCMVGAYDELELALENSLSSSALVKLQQRVRGAQLFREANLKGLASWLRTHSSKHLGKPFTQDTRQLFERWQADPRPVVFWIVGCLVKEGQVLAAEFLRTRYWPTPADQGKYRQTHRLDVAEAAWLDDYLGLGFSHGG